MWLILQCGSFYWIVTLYSLAGNMTWSYKCEHVFKHNIHHTSTYPTSDGSRNSTSQHDRTPWSIKFHCPARCLSIMMNNSMQWYFTYLVYDDVLTLSCTLGPVIRSLFQIHLKSGDDLLHCAVSWWRWCFLICLLRWTKCTKDMEQTEQRRGRSPVCVHMCDLRWAFCEKLRVQMWHWNGRSPVWMTRCLTKDDGLSAT